MKRAGRNDRYYIWHLDRSGLEWVVMENRGDPKNDPHVARCYKRGVAVRIAACLNSPARPRRKAKRS